MKLLVYSGLLYLIGISIILILKPELMFAKDGKWKEFGLGRNKELYTWIPFWLFSIIWAIISYIIVLIIADANVLPGVEVSKDISIPEEIVRKENISKNSSIEEHISLKNTIKKQPSSIDMKPGYYILDAQETINKGIPKYIYLGPEAPNLIYKSTDE
jgi:hypothetical protein